MAGNNIFFAGSGNKNPAVWMGEIKASETPLIPVSTFPKGHSVYALAVSPNGLYVAAATKAGLIRAHGLTNLRIKQNTPAVFEMYHNAPVMTLAFMTDDYLVSGGMDGKIKVWSVSQNKILADFQAHPGGVYALCSLGTLVLSSLGADGKLRLWDMDSLRCMHESGSVTLPGICGLISLVSHPVSGLLIHPTHTGELNVYNLRNEDIPMRTVAAHQGDCCAVAMGYPGQGSDGWIATGGMEDGKIKIWSADAAKCLYEASTSNGIASLCWCSDHELLVVPVEGKAQRWSVKEGLYPGNQLIENDIRVCTGLPFHLAVHGQKLQNKVWLDQKLNEAKVLLHAGSPDETKAFFRTIEELEGKGFPIEANILLADHAKLRNKPLLELETRLWLVEALEQSKALVPELYDLANLLVRLDQPEEALRYFNQIVDKNEDYRDTQAWIKRIKSHPLLGLDTRQDVHAGLAKNDRLIQEVETSALLQKPFTWKVLLQTLPPFQLKEQPSLQECWAQMQEQSKISRFALDPSKSGIKRFSLYQNKQIREVEWLYLVSNQLELNLGCGVEPRMLPNGSVWTVYLIFDAGLLTPSKSSNVEEHNQRILQAWSQLQNNPEVKHWFDTVQTLVKGVIQKQGQITLAHKEDDF